MKKKIISAVLATAVALPVFASACGSNDNEAGKEWYTDYATVTSENYNKNLYYLNELKFDLADPSVIYIDHGEEQGYFYAYGTSDMINGYGIQCWRSKDLTNWEYKSVAYHPDFDNCWDYENHWAPEVIYDEELGLYLMFYNADWINRGNAKHITVVSSETPYGPFIPYTDELATRPAFDFSQQNSAINPAFQCRDTIDAHPFIDPVTHDKYLYYSGYNAEGGSRIYGVKMKSWLEPDYSTVKQLTKNFNTSVDRDDNDIDECDAWVNEGAFMWYHDGQYILTFSVSSFEDETYQVRQAFADDPLGNFVKVQPDEDGGQIIVTDSAWETMTSAGHHCFIQCGDALMIAYHTFKNRNDITEGRALAVDTISYVQNRKGQTVMHANGPTYAYQPLPEEVSGYKNVAPLAKVTATNVVDGSDVKTLTDGTIKIHEFDPVKEFQAEGQTQITLEFDNFVYARSILVYNSSEFYDAFSGVSEIRLRYKSGDNSTSEIVIKDVAFDSEWHSDTYSMIYPGANAIAEFKDLAVDKITITIDSKIDDDESDVIALNEIIVLGKESKNPRATTSFEPYKYSVPADVSPIPVYESATFGSVGEDFVSSYGFDLSHDDGTENAYVDKYWCGNQQHLYFKDALSTVFYVEAELSVLDHTKTYINDPAPKIGIIMKSLDGYKVFYCIDCSSDFNYPFVGLVESNLTGTDYDFARYKTFSTPSGIKYTGENFTKLGIARVNDKLYLFADGYYITTISGLRGFTSAQRTACAVGFLTFNAFTRFRNYSITTDQAEVLEKLNSFGVAVED